LSANEGDVGSSKRPKPCSKPAESPNAKNVTRPSRSAEPTEMTNRLASPNNDPPPLEGAARLASLCSPDLHLPPPGCELDPGSPDD
jgi:hypothetical protein